MRRSEVKTYDDMITGYLLAVIVISAVISFALVIR